MNHGRKSWLNSVAAVFVALTVIVLLIAMSLLAVVMRSYRFQRTNLPPLPQSQPEWLDSVQAGDTFVQPSEVNAKNRKEAR